MASSFAFAEEYAVGVTRLSFVDTSRVGSQYRSAAELLDFSLFEPDRSTDDGSLSPGEESVSC